MGWFRSAKRQQETSRPSNIGEKDKQIAVALAAAVSSLSPRATSDQRKKKPTLIKRLVSKSFLRNIISLSLLATACSLMLIASITIYIIFYKNYIPYESIRIPIDFVYTDEYSPRAAFPLYPSRSIDDTLIERGMLIPNVNYALYINIDLPVTNFNRAQGNFMLNTQIFVKPPSKSRRYFLTASSSLQESELAALDVRKHSILHYDSNIVRYMKVATFAPLYVLGLLKEVDRQHLKLISGWKFYPDSDIEWIQLTLSKSIEIYNVDLEFKVQWTGLRYIMHRYKYSCAIIGIGLFWLVSISSTFFTYIIVVSSYMLYSKKASTKIIPQPPTLSSEKRPDIPPLWVPPKNTTSSPLTSVGSSNLTVVDSKEASPPNTIAKESTQFILKSLSPSTTNHGISERRRVSFSDIVSIRASMYDSEDDQAIEGCITSQIKPHHDIDNDTILKGKEKTNNNNSHDEDVDSTDVPQDNSSDLPIESEISDGEHSTSSSCRPHWSKSDEDGVSSSSSNGIDKEIRLRNGTSVSSEQEML